MTRSPAGRGRILLVAASLVAAVALAVAGAVPAFAATTITISGHVSVGDASHAAADGQVQVSWANGGTTVWAGAPSVMTDASGNYSITGLPAGNSYSLRFDTLSGLTGSVEYPNYPVQPRVLGHPINGNTDQSGINVIMPSPADVTGHVTLGAAGAPVPTGQVQVTYQRDTGQTSFTADAAAVATDASGNYLLPALAAGWYTLYFSYVGSGPYLSGYYGGQDTFGSRQEIRVIGNPVTADMVMHDQMTISGQVSLGYPDAGQPASTVLAGAGEVSVSYGYSATSSTGPFTPAPSKAVLTTSGGNYTFTGLTWGYYQLHTSYVGSGGSYREYPSANYVVQLPYTASYGLAMQKLIGASGHVSLNSSAHSAGSGDVQVSAVNPIGGFVFASALTDGSGNYSLTGIPQGELNLKFSYVGAGPNTYTDLYNGTAIHDQREDAVANAVLILQSNVSGRVTDDGGNPVAGGSVRVDIYDHASRAFQSNLTTTTDANGQYHFSNLPHGDYTVEFFPLPSSVDAPEAYNDADIYYEPDYLDGSQGGTFSGIDAQLEVGGTATGRVDVPNAPESEYGDNGHVHVDVFVLDGSTNQWVDTGDSYYAAAGTHAFTIPQLPPDDYKFEAVYDGSMGNKQQLSGVVHVTAGHVSTGVNFTVKLPLPSGNPIGSLDSVTVTPGTTDTSNGIVQPTGATASLRGWALDPDTTDPIEVSITFDGQQLGDPLDASESRPDIAIAYPAYGDAHGFSVDITDIPAGAHTICARASQVGPGPDVVVGCKSVTAPGGNGFGHIDSVTGGNGMVTIRGWAIDPDVSDPVTVIPYYQDNIAVVGVYPFGSTLQPSVTFLADKPRADIAAAYPGYGAAHGFSQTVIGFPAGNHRICVDLGPIGRITFNAPPVWICSWASVGPGLPFGSIDSVTTGIGTATLSGWAVDPDVSSSISVHFYVDGVYNSQLVASDARADVAAAYLGAGSPHGFSTTLSGLSAGSHSICVYGINQGPAAANAQLACRTVVVPAIGGLLKGSGPAVYLLDGASHLIPVASFASATDAGVSPNYATVADSFISGMTIDPQPLSNIVTCGGASFVSASGALWPVSASLTTGFVTSALSTATCAALPHGTSTISTALFFKTASSARVYWMTGNTKRPVSSMAAASFLSSPAAPVFLTVGDGYLASIPTGPLVLPVGSLVKATGPTVYLVDTPSHVVPLSAFSSATDAGVSSVFSVVADGDLPTGAGVDAQPLSNVLSCAGTAYVSGSGMIHPITSSLVTALPQTSLSAATCALLPHGAAVSGALFVKSSSSSLVYWVSGSTKRPVLSGAAANYLSAPVTPQFLTVGDAFLASLTTGPDVLPVGSLVKSAGQPAVYFVDSPTHIVPLDAFAAATDAGISSTVTVVPSADLGVSTDSTVLSNLVTCGAAPFISGSGKIWPLSSSLSGFTPTTLTAATCASLPHGSTLSNVLVKGSGSAIYQLTGGVKQIVTSWAAVLQLAGANTVPYLPVGDAFLNSIPAG